MALTLFVLKRRTTLPMSKFVQSSGRSGFRRRLCGRDVPEDFGRGIGHDERASPLPASAKGPPLGAAEDEDDELPVLAARAAEAALSAAATSSSPSAPSSSPSRMLGA